MHEIYELKEMLMKELEEYGRKGELENVGSLEIIDKLAHAIKNICKIIEAAEEEEEYSMAGGSYEGGNMGGGNSYARGGSGGGQGGGQSRNSYARGRGRNARRDSMGRYSSESRRYSREGGMNRYSREGGYSRADEMEDMVESIRSMMGELPQEVQRDAQRFVQKLEENMM